MPKAAYLHIPFCNQICHYCDFNKVFIHRQPVDEYLDCMEKEIIYTLKKHPRSTMETIFVGGGTPTALNDKQLNRLLTSIHTHLMPNSSEVEYTFEANPDDMTREKLVLLKDAGVNRLSFGVQSFNDELLKKIGRSHSAKQAHRAIEMAQDVGFHNINVDLIYSLPDQTIPDFMHTLLEAFSLGIQHFSAYSLIIEPKTVFYTLMNKNRLPLPSQEDEATMYEILMEQMERHGYHQYEISNFAKAGLESKHNLTYWNNEEYYGFGAGSHGYVNGHRNANYGPLKKYMAKLADGELPYIESHKVTKEEAIQEEMFLGLRRMSGVNKMEFRQKYGMDIQEIFSAQIKLLLAQKLIEETDSVIRLTHQGKFLGNEVFQRFI
ncbi:radical SAM family heme chaperone HemW [Priestia taiwanensis]|uniref:Heme chaperone HemW n=1 Tax=Priestia taiwanensis TaxID=1347902 RepID=A0A917ATZ8_9BACI|nr:radical SAM family heme chaperone HemW [Priestia taiwanensis]MBM7363732.1 oxygen-independent coproporphyrinogen-3 oxidase [Priestia taiwanensis]GGE74576.1 coproporphyrinogen III oxidase [Priestia taiwanensis]